MEKNDSKKRFNELLHRRHVLVGELRSKLIKEVGVCENCGYSEFLEVLEIAHICHGHEEDKHVRENVFLLCPTCHRAFDRGLLEIKGEVSDCHLVKYRSPFVLVNCWKKIDKNKAKSRFVWKRTGEGKFVQAIKK